MDQMKIVAQRCHPHTSMIGNALKNLEDQERLKGTEL
jgi:hypothetical protein